MKTMYVYFLSLSLYKPEVGDHFAHLMFGGNYIILVLLWLRRSMTRDQPYSLQIYIWPQSPQEALFRPL